MKPGDSLSQLIKMIEEAALRKAQQDHRRRIPLVRKLVR